MDVEIRHQFSIFLMHIIKARIVCYLGGCMTVWYNSLDTS
jgi:hypothetical protein